jgi:hypothetical protein
MDNKYHISQFFNLAADDEIDFFDANLVHDSRVFIDPFLLKNSPVQVERDLFDRFGDFFRYAYDKSLEVGLGNYTQGDLKKLLTIHEPKYINMGYTVASNEGHGPSLSDRLLTFFIDTTARTFVRETQAFPEHKYNPVSLQVFTYGIGFDGISDITANLIMDYLVAYTNQQAETWGITQYPNMKLDYDGFDFDDMKWKRGNYYRLPRNPVRPDEPLILVPRRLLRGFDELHDNPASIVMSILRTDPELSAEFASLVIKPIKEVSIEDIQAVFKSDISVHKRYLEVLEQDRNRPYNFEKDPLNLLADKRYTGYFANTQQPTVNDCNQLNEAVRQLVGVFRRHFETMDGWKQAWRESYRYPMEPALERSIGMVFRGMGLAYFERDADVHFLPEVGTGNGNVDFLVIHNDCAIAIEFKLLKNSASTGPDKIPAYMHGVQKQLPNYVINTKAKYAYYLTGQHFKSDIPKQLDHSGRVLEIQAVVPTIQSDLRARVTNFRDLTYINVEMLPHGTASEL